MLGKTPDSTVDVVNGFKCLKDLYLSVAPDYQGSWTVPVLWDKKTKTIVNNESSEIIRMFNYEFNEWAENKTLDLYPKDLRTQIDEVNSWIYPNINDGVYKCGFAKSQEAYSNNVKILFESLDKVEQMLSKSRYLLGNSLTEADIRLWTTVLRFDPVYFTHFKTNIRRIVDYPNLYGFVRDIYQTDGLKDTFNLYETKHHYFESHRMINPYGIVPEGPLIDYDLPHNRHTLGK